MQNFNMTSNRNFDYREESETEEESGEIEEESSNEHKGIEDDSEDKIESNISHLLKKGTDIKKLDWCGYLLKCFKRTKTLWKGGLFNGPSTFLTVLYAQKCMPIVLKRSSTTTVITKSTARKFIMLQKEMIASNKMINASDTDIETHEIIAAKTTLEKERMTKSKIIAAKNAVSQSPIKAINLGDKSGKASNGISNTPKDAQLNGFLMNKTDFAQNEYYLILL
ncbi:hypothetical protein Tco_1400226 [Tanacetum coccineum]